MQELLAKNHYLEQKFLAAKDPSFRARATVEYKRIASWVGKKISFDAASILDFGCGEGVPAASFAMRHPGSKIIGYDIAPVKINHLSEIFAKETGEPLPTNIEFKHDWATVADRKFDLIYAWSVFEHLPSGEINNVLLKLRNSLALGGVIFINCEPLFFSPHGSHLRRYLKSPWRHLRDSLSNMKDSVISEYATEREAREWQQFTSLNRYTHHDFKNAFENAGFIVSRAHLSRTSEPIPEDLKHIFNEDAMQVEAAQFLLLADSSLGQNL